MPSCLILQHSKPSSKGTAMPTLSPFAPMLVAMTLSNCMPPTLRPRLTKANPRWSSFAPSKATGWALRSPVATPLIRKRRPIWRRCDSCVPILTLPSPTRNWKRTPTCSPRMYRPWQITPRHDVKRSVVHYPSGSSRRHPLCCQKTGRTLSSTTERRGKWRFQPPWRS